MQSANKGGRPTAWTAELQKRIVREIERGVAPDTAAGAAGIGRRTYFEWMQRGDAGEEPFSGFRTAVTRALDVFEQKATKRILAGDKGMGFGPAKATLEVLSRRLPRRWAQQVKHHVETVEDEFFSALEETLARPDVLARVCETKDCRVVLAVFCEVLASREGAGSPEGDPGGRSDAAVH